MLVKQHLIFAFNKSNNSLSTTNESILAGDTDGVTSTELSSLYVKEFEGMFTFASTTYEYSLPVYNSTIKLEVVATAKDKDATVTIVGNEYLVAQNGSVIITVSNGIASNSVYKIYRMSW